MISDILCEAVEGMDKYLNDKSYDAMYEGELRREVVAVRTIMDRLRSKLDAPPVFSGDEIINTRAPYSSIVEKVARRVAVEKGLIEI